MKLIERIFAIFFLSLIWASASWAALPKEADIQTQLAAAKESDQSDVNNKILVQNLEETLTLLGNIEKQKADNAALSKLVDNAPKQVADLQVAVDKLKNTAPVTLQDFEKLSLTDLQTQSIATQQNLQQIQTDLLAINAQLVSQRAAPERAQSALSANLIRSQEIDKLLFGITAADSVEKTKLETELVLIGLQNTYNQMLLQGNNDLTSLYTIQLEQKNLMQQQLQTKLSMLQEVINEKNLQETRQQAEQLKQSQTNVQDSNPIIVEQQNQNVRISQDLVKQTAQLNALSQDSLRIKSVLDNLQQTERNINEQISALQGTLVLSRIINKQKQLLPQDQMIRGLPKQITDLRVQIFDLTELRDNLYDTQSYISNLEKSTNTHLTDDEKSQLTTILQERRKLLSDSITNLNNQLNLAINIELNQQQVTAISDALQGKLQQQSFWVRSNPPLDMDWFTNFLPKVKYQLQDIKRLINFSNWKDNLLPTAVLVILLMIFTALIQWRKEKITQHLAYINSKINTLKGERQRYTPEAIFWTLILCLRSTFIFLSALILIASICFEKPEPFWVWSFRMAGYWLFFAFILAMLRPNGLAYRHFNMPQSNVQLFYSVSKRSVWIYALWLNASIFTNLDAGITNDVIGEVLTISILVISLFIVGPRLRYAVSIYQKTQEQAGERSYLFKFSRIVLVIAPIALIVLIVMGYYYTALNLMEHLISSYFVLVIWMIARDVVYRGFTVSARRLAYRRLQEKIQAQQAQKEENNNDLNSDYSREESLAISQVKSQVKSVVDLLLWLALFGLFYWVWSDLITVAYYLEGVTLWQQQVVTETGTVSESITLLNLLFALIIIIGTYALVKNIGGLLEVLVFSRMSFSQGTPYTITTLLTYFIIAIGGGAAFSVLGMSWSKLQWLFAALSVGLGFGLQEIFANFISGIIILFERPVRIGDVVTIGEYSGTVSKIRIRSTTLIDFDKKEVIVPNKAFVTERLINWALTDSMTRVVLSVGVAYGSDLELVKRLLLQAADECEYVLKDPEPVAYFLTFGASTLDHELRVYVGNLNERTRTIDYVNRRIDELFAAHNVEIAFNQLDVFIKNPTTSQEIKIVSENLAKS
ncbi:mechanosensitive channel MscK [Avibacterium gallinarum]|uniref:MscS family protein n=1 Tax=Avibacterium gallinarum TaxID=755 RepID=A0A379AUU9_AVIGA|nr:mechanosensitive channel MscK [Avibacterium gallinarum]POY45338.1 mechanosensitive channel MscK [Avibacterium gallinarum]TDP27679.1 potassium efflux system protein [Avibacterium gallinarum]SUB26095.1 MscS family protein [Avibacterium gallinarum]